MNQQELEAKVKMVLSDKSYLKELLELDTPEKVKKSLSDKGIDLSIEEIIKINSMLTRDEDSEMDDDDLASVSGGMKDNFMVNIIRSSSADIDCRLMRKFPKVKI